MKPLVSVITPTWNRHDWLLSRCIASVQAQTYQNIEHIIVSDGPDPDLYLKLSQLPLRALQPHIRYFEMPSHDPEPHWGAAVRRKGLAMALGEYITYCDDDDRLYPKHCQVLQEHLEREPDAMWAYSQMMSHSPHGEFIVAGPPREGSIGTPMVMHRPELLRVANWGPDNVVEDWQLFSAWMQAGHEPVRVDAITSEVWPSAYR